MVAVINLQEYGAAGLHHISTSIRLVALYLGNTKSTSECARSEILLQLMYEPCATCSVILAGKMHKNRLRLTRPRSTA